MASMKSPSPFQHSDSIRSSPLAESFTSEDSENIPYHAREYARPFTYGNLPSGFKTSELNHVAVEPASPLTLRKSVRPSISPSRPVLRKTPTRQEFEEMLMERREQALKEQHTIATQQAQNAAIQKDLDELQQILNENILYKPVQNFAVTASSVDLIDETLTSDDEKNENDHIEENSASAFVKAEVKRPETPLFPATPNQPLDERCVSPYPMVSPGTPTLKRVNSNASFKNSVRGETPPNAAWNVNSTSNTTEPHDVAPHLVKFAKDSSEYWYKPHITREEAIALLRNAIPGTFIIRNSTTYKNAYGLVMRVDKLPQGVPVPDNSSSNELVRHFLLEPTHRGVRLKGCTNEPVFTSLSALVYQHSINKLALPCKLTIPDRDLLLSSGDAELVAAQKLLLIQGAACNVLYLFSCDMESLTGDEAIRKAIYEMYSKRSQLSPTEVHFKVSQQGITLTDNTRRLFFRRHYTPDHISHCAIDPDNRFWSVEASDEGISRTVNKTIFAFVARPTIGTKDNQCHVFCDLAASQPASAIVSFANKVLPMDKRNHKML